MIFRTPSQPKRPRPASPSPAPPENPLVIYEDPSPSSLPLVADSSSPQPLLCTYQCRQMVKSEFVDALSSAEKQVLEYRSKLENLNSSYSQADAERKSYRDQVLNLQQEVAAAKARERSLQEQLLKDVNHSQERYKKQLEIQIKLEKKIESERILREKYEGDAASAKSIASDLERELQNISESKERDTKDLNEDLLQIQQTTASTISKLELDLEKMECRATHAEDELKILNEKLNSMSTQLKECLNEKTELEKKILSFSYQEGSSTESDVLIKHLQDELRRYENEVRAARKMKESHEEIEILKEKLLEEKSSRERAQAELIRLQSVDLNAQKIEEEISCLKSIVNNIPDVLCADDIPLKFSALQKEIIVNMTKLGESNALLRKLEVALDAAQLDKTNAETEASIAKEKIEALKQEMKQMNLLISTVTTERDALTKVIEELKESKNDSSVNSMDTSNLLLELESALKKKESCIKELESGIHEVREMSRRQVLDIEFLNDKINNEARRSKSLERENDRLLQQIALLESKIGHGDFSTESTKVLRMVNTPSLDPEVKQTIESLQAELHMTKEKLTAVEELKSHSGYDGKLVDSYISGKITQLKEQVATLEKREERYKTVFAERISVFRRACCELFGYKIVMDEHQRHNGIPVTRFTLKSIYADSDDEKLEFEYESGNTNLLGNDYTSQSDVSRQIEIFVRKMNSIPAFTANLTIESFNRRTLS